jgi:predicted dehydrogenase
MQNKTYNIGVIGVGVWGCHSLEQELLNTGRCKIKTVCGNESFGAGMHKDAFKAAKAYAEQLSARFVENADEIINDPEIDIISIMTAPVIKPEYLIKALKNNKHIVTDKPLGMSVGDVQAVCDAEKLSKGNVFMLCGYHTRPAVKKLIEYINIGTLGAIKAVSIRLNFTGGLFPGFTPCQRWANEIQGGESVTIGSHAIMTAMKLACAQVTESFQLRKNDFYQEYATVNVDDYAIFNLQFKNGAVGNISVGRLPYRIPNEDIIIEVTGTEGYAEVNGTKLKIYPDQIEYDGSFNPQELLCIVFSQFLDSIENPAIQPISSFQDGLELQKILCN